MPIGYGHRQPAHAATDFDVLIASDFGRAGELADEIEVQARLGLRTGLIAMGPAPLADRIRDLVVAGLAEVAARAVR
jgi:hypothetical protein